jgi:GNAT superfamily N-acetyltransferase
VKHTFCTPTTPGHVTARLGQSLAAAFRDAPDYSFILAHHPDKVGALSWFFGGFAVRLALRLGAIHTTSDGDAGILTFGPGRSPSLLMLLRAGVLSFPRRFGWRGTWRAFSLGIAMERQRLARAPMPHWYVLAVGVTPARQGHGLGHDLLTHTLSRADAEGVPCYLEAFEKPLVEHYTRRGFQVLSEHALPSGLTLWCLLRAPAARHAFAP